MAKRTEIIGSPFGPHAVRHGHRTKFGKTVAGTAISAAGRLGGQLVGGPPGAAVGQTLANGINRAAGFRDLGGGDLVTGIQAMVRPSAAPEYAPEPRAARRSRYAPVSAPRARPRGRPSARSSSDVRSALVSSALEVLRRSLQGDLIGGLR